MDCMDSTNSEFIKENKYLFRLFRWSGILIYKKKGLKWASALFFSRLLWFLWQILGTGLSIWSAQTRLPNSIESTPSSTESMPRSNESMINSPKTSFVTQSKILYESVYEHIPFILLLLLFLGPIQGNIMKCTMECFPKIWENIKKLEEMEIDKYKKTHEEESDLDSAEKGHFFYKCYSKNWIPKISVLIFVILFMVSVIIAAYKVHDSQDLLDEYKLIAVMFYLPLPWLTSLFVITLIKQITKLYQAIYDLKDEMFTESENIQKVSDYLGLLQSTVEKMMNDIFEFTLGINFAIFVTSAVMCSYELIEGVKGAEKVTEADGEEHRELTNSFAEVDYLIPLFLCILPMFWICKVSDNLMTNVHAKLRLRIRTILPELYLQHYNKTTHPCPKDWSDKPFKKLEFIYKTLKEWPPQVYIYGGWRVNYQLLSAIILFIFANSRFSI